MGFEFRETEFEFGNNNIYTLNAIPEGNSNLFDYNSDFIYIADSFTGPKNNGVGISNSNINTGSGGNSKSNSELSSGNGGFEFFNSFVISTKKFSKNKGLGNGLIILINTEGTKFLP